MPTKNIKYLSRDFDSFKQELVNFAKTYYPTTYNDFSAANPGAMFILMASYVGDVLSYYLDNSVGLMFIQHAEQRDSIYNIAQAYGYKPPLTAVASTDILVSVTVPAITNGTQKIPDYRYIPSISPGMIINSTKSPSIKFTVLDIITFYNDDPNVLLTPIYNGGIIESYTLTKTVKAISANRKTITVSTPSNPVK